MSEISIKWRPSGGRGEFEFTPSSALIDRHLVIRVPDFPVDIPSEVWGRRVDGKPRLRKLHSNVRTKLHIPQLIMALAKLPEPMRQDKGGTAPWPLENKGFVLDSIVCEVIEDNGAEVVLSPKRLTILHSDKVVDLTTRFADVAAEMEGVEEFTNPELRQAIKDFWMLIGAGTNTRDIRIAADKVIQLQAEIFGPTNAGSNVILQKIAQLPPSELEEDIQGVEGRILTRFHSYRERDRTLVKKAKAHFKAKHGELYCEACGLRPESRYGTRGLDRIHAHHRTAIEEIIPGSVTKYEDLAMVCANCHDIIHATRPWLTVGELQALLNLAKA